jgi:hypothetical protein
MSRRALGNLGTALRAAGVKAASCAIHGSVKPCKTCGTAFTRAESQRKRQQIDESRAIHAAYLARGGK